MATNRHKTAGFTAPEAEEETASVERLLEKNAAEMFETFSRIEGEPEEKIVKVAPPLPVVLPEISPTEDAGPRFVEESATPVPQPLATPQTPQLQPRPKRHPRNIPKFSRYK
jgi:hypothetical protein